ncbi:MULTISPECIES: GNAT family N-acetyltransferase [Paenibacillus]|uniref:GNAT family N-acetyltransferase n=1 Tax=Paenibacillus xylanilyticus TaxID=248903 RepID=A0A7Y6BWE7_9BACL|nr:GNAT family N-acetyltransferase [Paenibacillus xylanilyticus]NUU76127.1 GNAT family N-acetyltransferase [Paenibacillus xylanilyticus]
MRVDRIHIRKAEARDYPGVSLLMNELHQMHVEARPDVYRALQSRMEKQEFVELLDTDMRYLFVAESSSTGRILGYGSAQLSLIQNVDLLCDRKILYINELVVGSGQRGQGTGKKLMHALIEMGRELQADSVELTVSTFNTGAQAFYEQMGLSVRSSRMEYIL